MPPVAGAKSIGGFWRFGRPGPPGNPQALDTTTHHQPLQTTPCPAPLLMTRPIRIVSWNIARRTKPWYELLDMDADIALLQEAAEPPAKVRNRITVDSEPWTTAGEDSGRTRRWRTAVVALSDRVEVEWFGSGPVGGERPEEFPVSRQGTLAAATVCAPGYEPFFLASMYAAWESPHESAQGSWIYADASAHRLISDLSGFIGTERRHRILAAGDLNILYGHGEHGSRYWAARYESVFTRMAALDVPFIGPQAPDGRQADPWPDELPRISRNVPTYYHNRQDPTTATRQLDFVFASRDFADSVVVRAPNEPERWGPSDHCRLDIEVW